MPKQKQSYMVKRCLSAEWLIAFCILQMFRSSASAQWEKRHEVHPLPLWEACVWGGRLPPLPGDASPPQWEQCLRTETEGRKQPFEKTKKRGCAYVSAPVVAGIKNQENTKHWHVYKVTGTLRQSSVTFSKQRRPLLPHTGTHSVPLHVWAVKSFCVGKTRQYSPSKWCWSNNKKI